MDNTTIFDDEFLSGLKVKRRAMMPKVLKVYTWIVVGLSALLCLLGVLVFKMEFIDYEYSFIAAWEDGWVGFLDGAVGLFVMVGAILLWMEVEWAIVYNLTVMVVFVVTMMGVAPIAGDKLMTIFQLCLPVLFIPYWIMLYPLRKKWRYQ